VVPLSNEKDTPDTPTPSVNGQSLSGPALQASMSMLSLAPAASTVGWLASIATAGSFCLLAENGAAGLPTVTSVSGLNASAVPAGAATNAATATRSRTRKGFLMPPPLGAEARTPCVATQGLASVASSH
jgi:hypothetical protein